MSRTEGRASAELRECYAEVGDQRLRLTGDIRGLIHELGTERALLAGHGWGGSIAWATAMNHPEVVDRLAILNAAHPRKLSQ